VKFDNMGAFTYSAQDGTPAARMVDQVTEEIKENRYHELMAAQAEISEENNRNLIGVDTEVLVEELLDDGCGNNNHHIPLSVVILSAIKSYAYPSIICALTKSPGRKSPG